MENVNIDTKGNTVSAELGSVKVKCDHCTCDILDPDKVNGDDLSFCKSCEDCMHH